MSLLSSIKGWFSMMGKSKAKKEFNIEPVGSEQMVAWTNECVAVYQGSPSWINEDDHIDTVNFAKAICSETARLATLSIGIRCSGSARADWLQRQIDRVNDHLRDWVEYGCAYGTVILKPNGENIDLYTPGEFEITHATDGKVDGAVFHNWVKQGEKWFTRLEYHRYEGKLYVITNKCYEGKTPDDCRKPVDIKLTPWAEMAEEASVENIERPLFGVLRTPQANNIDMGSPYGLPIFSEAIQELRDLDIAYSRNAKEIKDSKRTVLADDSMIAYAGEPVAKNATAVQARAERLGMPDMVKMVRGDGRETYYQEINPELNTDTRLKGINALLSQIGYKSGFSNGYLVFNESTGIQTATGVEAEQQRTIQTIKDMREKLKACIDGVVYALSVIADLYGFAPSGTYELVYDFGDITYNHEEDRAKWWGYVLNGKVPAWMYFVKFEGMTEEDAKAMVAEAAPKNPTLFAPEE